MIGRSWKSPGKGTSRGEGRLRYATVGFDDETFEEIQKLAAKAGVSFGEQNRLVAEFGLETIRQMESEDRKPEPAHRKGV